MNQPTQVNFFEWNVVNLPNILLTNEIVIERILVALMPISIFVLADLSVDTQLFRHLLVLALVPFLFGFDAIRESHTHKQQQQKTRQFNAAHLNQIFVCFGVITLLRLCESICDENIHVTKRKYQHTIESSAKNTPR